MKRQKHPYLHTFVIILALFLFFACGSNNENANSVSKEHAALIGKWIQKESGEEITWEFSQYEVKWKGFTHFYSVKGDSLIISGIVYQLIQQEENELKLSRFNTTNEHHEANRIILLERVR